MKAGHDENVDGKKAAKRRAADGVPTEHEPRQPIADEGNPSRLFGGDDHGPGGCLVPAQQLPGESHDQRETEQQHAGGPVHFPREFVGAEQKSLRHMRADHQHHRRRAKVMQAAQETAKRRVVRDEDQRVVGLRRGRDVRKRQRHAGDHLHDEGHHAWRCQRHTTSPRRAAPDVSWTGPIRSHDAQRGHRPIPDWRRRAAS